MTQQKIKLSFWARMGCYFEIVFGLLLIISSFFGMLGSTIKYWDDIYGDMTYRIAYSLGWAVVTAFYFSVWLTIRSSFKKLLEV